MSYRSENASWCRVLERQPVPDINKPTQWGKMEDDSQVRFAELRKKYGSLSDARSLRSELNFALHDPEEELTAEQRENASKTIRELTTYLFLGEES